MKKTIGRRLRDMRGDKTQAQVAKDLGISPSAVASYENNVRIPRDPLKRSFAEYYGTTVQDLFF